VGWGPLFAGESPSFLKRLFGSQKIKGSSGFLWGKGKKPAIKAKKLTTPGCPPPWGFLLWAARCLGGGKKVFFRVFQNAKKRGGFQTHLGKTKPPHQKDFRKFFFQKTTHGLQPAAFAFFLRALQGFWGALSRIFLFVRPLSRHFLLKRGGGFLGGARGLSGDSRCVGGWDPPLWKFSTLKERVRSWDFWGGFCVGTWGSQGLKKKSLFLVSF